MKPEQIETMQMKPNELIEMEKKLNRSEPLFAAYTMRESCEWTMLVNFYVFKASFSGDY